jgi:peptide methionine sulfoxide reductase MsrA
MVCPECLAAYSFYNKAKSVSNIFTQILHLDDYILSEDWYHQGYAIGKITKELEGLSSILLEIGELEEAQEKMG